MERCSKESEVAPSFLFIPPLLLPLLFSSFPLFLFSISLLFSPSLLSFSPSLLLSFSPSLSLLSFSPSLLLSFSPSLSLLLSLSSPSLLSFSPSLFPAFSLLFLSSPPCLVLVSSSSPYLALLASRLHSLKHRQGHVVLGCGRLGHAKLELQEAKADEDEAVRKSLSNFKLGIGFPKSWLPGVEVKRGEEARMGNGRARERSEGREVRGEK
eukprot:159263-Hanusia_phi.AAC.3